MGLLSSSTGKYLDGGEFHASYTSGDINANVIFMPAYSTSPLFGVALTKVKQGKLGSFATSGVFAFAQPNSFTSSVGQAIYYKPTSAIAGTISTTATNDSILLGYEVYGANSSLLYVKLNEAPALIEVASSSST